MMTLNIISLVDTVQVPLGEVHVCLLGKNKPTDRLAGSQNECNEWKNEEKNLYFGHI